MSTVSDSLPSDQPAPDAQRDMAMASPVISVYWRAGCGFCSSLFRALDRRGVPYERVDIRSGPEAAARVRAVARGHETVPTVFVGEVPLVNPRVHEVLAVARHEVPEAVPEGYEPPQPGRVSRWLGARRRSR